jgi:hypothetical protein
MINLQYDANLPIENLPLPVLELLNYFEQIMCQYELIPDIEFGFVRLAVMQCIDKLCSLGYDSIKVSIPVFLFVFFFISNCLRFLIILLCISLLECICYKVQFLRQASESLLQVSEKQFLPSSRGQTYL